MTVFMLETLKLSKTLKPSRDDFKSESMRAPGRAATCHLADFHEILPV